MGREPAAARPRQAPQIRPAGRAAPCPLGDQAAEPVQLPRPRRRLDDRRHHRHHRRRPDPARARLRGLGRRSRTAGARPGSSPRRPILDFFSIQSARYAVKTETYKGVDVTVYYDPQHRLERRPHAAGAEGRARLLPGQFQPLSVPPGADRRVPRHYAQFAQSFAGTFPWSEGSVFIADYRDLQPDRHRHLCRRPRVRPPVVGPSDHRRRRAGGDHAVGDPGPVLGAAGDAAASTGPT